MPTSSYLRSGRIGITMRMVDAEGYNEPRDALAQDWGAFMGQVLPEALWMPVPNMGKDIIRYFSDWNLDGLILSGGNDLGSEVLRDLTEEALLQHALSRSLPVLGVCRGLQLLVKFYGGQLHSCDQSLHVAQRHLVIGEDDYPIAEQRRATFEVNSFHQFGLNKPAIPEPLCCWAYSEDGGVEALGIPETKVAATMWHPERERPVSRLDRTLVRWVFGWNS